ncbi:hypothetical protein GGR56DRAFT_687035 [Xylariaceae sp. FL0804]|nr:hypothetical protein GGR56DRAFT_687035 [Xylariaceae sp. FL0804]
MQASQMTLYSVVRPQRRSLHEPPQIRLRALREASPCRPARQTSAPSAASSPSINSASNGGGGVPGGDYGDRDRSKSKKNRAGARPGTATTSRDALAQVHFTVADVPGLAFWAEHATPPLVDVDESGGGGGDPSAAELLHAAARRYAELAVASASASESGGSMRQRLSDRISISPDDADDARLLDPFVLHTLATVLLARHPPAAAPWRLALHVLDALVVRRGRASPMLAYPPSVLTLARLALRTSEPQRKAHFAPVFAALDALARSHHHPNPRAVAADACTLQGLVALQLHRGGGGGGVRGGGAAEDNEADTPLAWFDRALRHYDNSDGDVGQWQTTCLREAARVRLDRPDNDARCRRQGYRDLWRAAHEFDDARSHLRLCELAAASSPSTTTTTTPSGASTSSASASSSSDPPNPPEMMITGGHSHGHSHSHVNGYVYGTPAYLSSLERAAVSDVPGAARLMARWHAERAAAATQAPQQQLSARERRWRGNVAREWRAFAAEEEEESGRARS